MSRKQTKSFNIYYENYVEARNPARKYYLGFRSALSDAMKWVKHSNISVSVNGYETVTEKKYYDVNGRTTPFTYLGIDYRSAVIEWGFLDFDVIDKEGNIRQSVLDSFDRYVSWLLDNDILYDIAFTGGGYQSAFSLSCSAEDYVFVMRDLIEKLNLEVDDVSLSDLRRVVGSFNFGKESKTERNRWCISLYQSELLLSFEEHRELAKKRRLGLNRYGSETYTPKKINRSGHLGLVELEHDPNFSAVGGVDEILWKYGYEYEDLCPYIRRIIEQPHVKHKHRLYLISYFKNVIGVSYSDMNVLLPDLLVGSHGYTTDGGHSIREGQVKNVYLRNLPFNVDLMHKEGLCPNSCNECEELQKMVWRAAMS